MTGVLARRFKDTQRIDSRGATAYYGQLGVQKLWIVTTS